MKQTSTRIVSSIWRIDVQPVWWRRKRRNGPSRCSTRLYRANPAPTARQPVSRTFLSLLNITWNICCTNEDQLNRHAEQLLKLFNNSTINPQIGPPLIYRQCSLDRQAYLFIVCPNFGWDSLQTCTDLTEATFCGFRVSCRTSIYANRVVGMQFCQPYFVNKNNSLFL